MRPRKRLVWLPVYVKLCYRECLTDKVPIPGEPCRDEENALAASRVKDDFRLELSLEKPEQREEQAMRGFITWLARIPIRNSTGAGDEAIVLNKFLEKLREVGQNPNLDGSSSQTLIATADFFIDPSHATEFLCTAFRIWVTELRPRWLGKNQTCAGNPPDECCVLLASLRVPVLLDADVWKVKAAVTTDPSTQVRMLEDDRPYVVSLRMLQEWALCGRSYQDGTTGLVGPKGDKGDKGDQGETGATGAQGDPGVGATGAQGLPGDSRIIAAGRFDKDGNTLFSIKDLQVVSIENNDHSFTGYYFVPFIPSENRAEDFSSKSNYVIKGTPVSSIGKRPSMFEVLEVEDKLLEMFQQSIEDGNARLKDLLEGEVSLENIRKRGVPIRVLDANREPNGVGFMIEISSFGEV
jgi:hypothetical protein